MFNLSELKNAVHLVSNAGDLDDAMTKTERAQTLFSTFSQQQVDSICENVVNSVCCNRDLLSRLEIEETGIGRYQDKLSKIMFSSHLSWEYMKSMKTCGIINEENNETKLEIACPIGIIAAYAPVTNPVPTAIFKGICCLKSRNGMILSPHVLSQESCVQALALVATAAVEAGAPDGLFSMVYRPKEKMTRPVMVHKNVGLVWATGGKGLVRHAYSSGKPAFGVGCANVPVILHPKCDIDEAITSIFASKVYDNGVLCASEEVIIVPEAIYDAVLSAMHVATEITVLTAEEGRKVGKVLRDGKHLNAKIIGQDSTKIAAMAGINWTEPRIANGQILVNEVHPEDFNKQNIWLKEKLSPCLSIFKVRDEYDAINVAQEILRDDGEGHSAIIHTNYEDLECRQYVRECSEQLRVSRITINQPGVSGTPGGPTSHNNMPSVSLGCGSWGGNSTTDNVGPLHLINKKRVNCMDSDKNIVQRGVSDPRILTRCCIEMFIELLERVNMVVTRGKFPSSNLRKCLGNTYKFLVYMADMQDFETTVKSNGIDIQTMATMTSMTSMGTLLSMPGFDDAGHSNEEEDICPEQGILDAIDIYMKHGYDKKLGPGLDIVANVCSKTAIPRSQVMVELFDKLVDDMDISGLLLKNKRVLESVGLRKRLDILQWTDYVKEMFNKLDCDRTNHAVRKTLNIFQQQRFDEAIASL